MVKVLFVCLGNICRSPSAEGVFRALLHDEGLSDKIEVDSCGTGSFHTGNPPDERAIATCAARDIDISGLRARQIRKTDFEKFDYIIGMDENNIQSLEMECPYGYDDRIHLFLDLGPYMETREVPDPYYGGDLGFQSMLNLIERASKSLLKNILENHLS